MKLFKKLLAAALFLFSVDAFAVGTCTITGIGTKATGPSPLTITLPTNLAGELILLGATTYSNTETVTTAPTGYTLLESSDGMRAYGKISTGTETTATIEWSNPGAAYRVFNSAVVHNTLGWPNIGSILGSHSNDTQTSTDWRGNGMTVVTGDCGFQITNKNWNTSGGVITSLAAASSGWTDLFGTNAFVNSGTNSTLLGGQMLDGQAATWTGKTRVTNGNTSSLTNGKLSFALLTGDNVPTAPSFTDKTGQAATSTISSAQVTLAGFDNYTKLVVSGDTGCKASVNGGAYLATTQYPLVGQSLSMQVTSGAAGTTKNCAPTLGDGTTVTDTFSVSVDAADSTAPAISVAIAQTAIAETSASASMTCTDASGAYTAYFGTYANGSTPTAANVKAGTGTGFVASTNASDAKATAVAASYSTGAHLTGSTAYDIKAICEDATGNQSAVQNLDITTSAPPANDAVLPVMVKDTATAADATTFAGRTPSPTNTPGNTWSVIKFFAPATISTVTVVSNKASAGAETGAVIDVETTDMIISEDIADYTVDHVLRTRSIDTDNTNACRFRTNRTIDLSTKVGGTTVNLATLVGGVPTASYEASMFAVGSAVGCLVDGVLKVSGTTISNATGTKAGFGSNAATSVSDNITVKRAYPCLNSSTGKVNDDPIGLFQGETLQSGCSYWASTLPTRTYNAWSLYEGGRWYYSPETAYVGADTFNWARWNPTLNTVETATWTFTTQNGANTAPVWSGIPDQSWQISVPVNLNLAAYQSTRGIPPSTCTVQSGALVSGMVLDGPNCVIGGIPLVSTVTPTSVTIRATSTALTADDTFLQTVTGDGVPDFPAFTDVTDATPTTLTTCPPAVVLSGTNIPAAITVTGDTGAKYSLTGAAATASAGTFVNGDTVLPEVTSGSAGTQKIVTVTAGGISRTCTVTATAITSADVDQFSFAPVIDAVINTPQEGCTFVTGNTALSPVTVSGGTVSINGVAGPGDLPIDTHTVDDEGGLVGANRVCAQHTSSGSSNTPVNTLVTIGGTVGTFTSTTAPAPGPTCNQIPNVKSWIGQTYSVDINTVCTGHTQTTVINPISDCSVAGSVITCNFTQVTSGAHASRVIHISANNNDGAAQTAITFEVTATESNDVHSDASNDLNDEVSEDLNQPL